MIYSPTPIFIVIIYNKEKYYIYKFKSCHQLFFGNVIHYNYKFNYN